MADSSADAERIVERYRRRAEAERARAEAESREQATREAHAIEAAGRDEAALILSRGRARIPALVATVVGSLTGERA